MDNEQSRLLAAHFQCEPGNTVLVGIADVRVGRSPQVLKTNLGSCIAVCLYCQAAEVGGMLHFMLASPLPKEREGFKKGKYAETGIPELITVLKSRFGVEQTQLTAKIFGGASLLPGVKHNIGLDNEAAARKYLREYGIRIIASKTGGVKGYKVDFDLGTGKVKCQTFDGDIMEF
ncbi:MAG: chemotaxis protein CheD [Elusimicrobiaceae bacterium]